MTSGIGNNLSNKLKRGYKHGSLTEGLIAYYPMEKGQGQVLHDAALDNIGQIKPGSSGGNATVSDMWTTGKAGTHALDFDGSDDYVDTNIASLTAPLTVSMWVNLDDTSSKQFYFGNFNGTNGDLYFLWDSSNSNWKVDDDYATNWSGGTASTGS